MERLTRRVNGVLCYTKGKYENTLSCEMEDREVKCVLKRLEEYEETGLTSTEINTLNDFIKSQIGVLLRELTRERKKMEWHKAETPPDSDRHILLSFANLSCPLVGHYEADEDGGAYYIGDDDVSTSNYGTFVNAWMELPEPHRGDVND